VGALLIFIFIEDGPGESGLKFDGKSSYSGPILITAAYMGHMWELYAFWGWIGPFMTAVVVQAGKDTALGGFLSSLIIIAGAPAVFIMGMVADKIGRIKTIIIAASCSLVPQFFFGYLLGLPITVVVSVGIWIGFWATADSAIYKAGLTEMIPERIRGTALGMQSAVGFAMTIIAPLVFGKVLDILNPKVSVVEAAHWGPCFLVLGAGALFAPLMALILRKNPQATLMAGGKM
jgi:MFS family permease